MKVTTFVAPPATDQPFIGVDANYSLDLEKVGQTWTVNGQKIDLFNNFAQQGVRGFRVRLWVSEDEINGKQYASEVAGRALKAGLETYLVLFLSEDWADLMKQSIPSIWKDQEVDERCVSVRGYRFLGLILINKLPLR